MEVKVIKMSNGDELIGRVGDAPNTYNHLHIVGIQQAPDGRFGVVMMPYLNAAPEATITLNSDLIVCVASPEREFEKNYLARSSKIVL